MKIKPKACRQCGAQFTPFNTLQPVCTPACAVKFNSKKEVEKRVKQMRKDSQSLNDLRSIARAVFQKYIRLRDAKHPCISCYKTDAKWDAGHYFKAEIYTGLIFNEDNVHKQCSYCNCQLAGNLIEYRKGLVKKIGEEKVLELEASADSSRVYKFGRVELQDTTVKYKAKIKELESRNNVEGQIYDVKIKF